MLAKELKADALLIDEVKGRSAAFMQGLHTIGTLRILYDAAVRDLCNLNVVYEKLQQTNFRAAGALYEHFLRLYEDGAAPSSAVL